MILGRGLIASAFRNSIFDHTPGYTVFASGVSNSSENDPAAYAREWALLNDIAPKSTTILYFSTISVFDPTKTKTPYIQHKQAVEKHIRLTFDSYMILRLPILVGRTDNPHTLMNYLINGLRDGHQMKLHARACRYLLDVEDVVPMILPFTEPPSPQVALNIPGSHKIQLPQLIRTLEAVLEQKGNYIWEEDGACYDIPEYQGEILYVEEEKYIEKIIRKYFSN